LGSAWNAPGGCCFCSGVLSREPADFAGISVPGRGSCVPTTGADLRGFAVPQPVGGVVLLATLSDHQLNCTRAAFHQLTPACAVAGGWSPPAPAAVALFHFPRNITYSPQRASRNMGHMAGIVPTGGFVLEHREAGLRGCRLHGCMCQRRPLPSSWRGAPSLETAPATMRYYSRSTVLGIFQFPFCTYILHRRNRYAATVGILCINHHFCTEQGRCPVCGFERTLGERLATSQFVKVCGCRPHADGAARTGAGVRKPPMESSDPTRTIAHAG
jgi:hypothetical protein